MSHPNTNQNDQITQFLKAVEVETNSAMRKFPSPNPNIAALTEEVGELAQAILHIREGKSTDMKDVRSEAIQVAAMAARCAIEGDPTLGVVPEAE